MAKCRACGNEIPEGTVYCVECEDKKKADESYLDSLLSSVVMNTGITTPERPKKKKTEKPLPTNDLKKKTPEPHKFDDALTNKLSDETQTEDIDESYDILKDADDSYLDELFTEESPEANLELEANPFYQEEQETELLDDLLRSVDEAQLTGNEEVHHEADDIAEPVNDDELDQEAMLAGEALAEEVFSFPDELTEHPSEEYFETNEADFTQDNSVGLSEENASEFSTGLLEDNPFAGLYQDSVTTEPEDIPMALNPDEVAADEDDIMTFWNAINAANEETEKSSASTASTEEEKSLLPEEDYINRLNTSEKDSEKQEPPRKKKNLFQRLFGNIREDLTPEQIEERKRIALLRFEEEEKRALDEAQQEKLSKEERAKRKKEEDEQRKADQQEKAQKKANQKIVKAEQKKAVKDKKEMARRALLEEIEENEGHINRFGASFIILLFAAILCCIALGTSVYTYRVTIEDAGYKFELQRYDDAYNDVYGLNIKEEDQELYDKVMTVQYVNIQLLSYMRYASLGMDAEALDSLFKGLCRYEKYISYGAQLGIKDDLNYLKDQIMEELSKEYGIGEESAYAMLDIESREEYSMKIYNIVSERE